MTVELLEIPDDTQALPRWLESQLLGTDLAALAAQLEAVHGTSSAAATSLDEVLGGNRASVLRDGLSGLKSDQLRKLLVNPRLLLDLQEALLLEGGPYWTQQASAATEIPRRFGPRPSAHGAVFGSGNRHAGSVPLRHAVRHGLSAIV